MACIDPEGNVSVVAHQVLTALGKGADLPGAAREANVPLYRVRASVRELVEAGLVTHDDGVYTLTPAARALIA